MCVLCMQYICKKSGWAENGRQWTHCRELFVELWDNLQDTADSDEDGQITVDEWVSTVASSLSTQHHPLFCWLNACCYSLCTAWSTADLKWLYCDVTIQSLSLSSSSLLFRQPLRDDDVVTRCLHLRSLVESTAFLAFSFFTARRVCIARTVPWQDVYLSHPCILSKRLYVSLKFFSPSGSSTALVYHTKRDGNIPTGTP